ncbi:class I SAM-dependent methyltransferase [Pseudonocardia sp. TRM90224]|uniref:class I SAM-dependent methyltransferase n=1 Tax=Pseudonocardia sp. TRM90224 TaxID=2812678 RepID=UPI001E5FDC35|nr:class I SAM-dependent methyltransferase [Pseudonocardia sp. TRM90224]
MRRQAGGGARWGCDTAGVVDGDEAERVLHALTDRFGRGPLEWAAAPLTKAERVLDLCCGTGALADALPGSWVGVDAAAGPRRPRIRGLATALPLRTSSVDGICMLLVLPRLGAVDAVFAELRRVLRPAGTLVLLVPSAAPRSLAELGLLRKVHRSGWTNRSALDGAGWLLTAADFALLSDDRELFRYRPGPEHDPVADTMALATAGVWPPSPAADVPVLLARRAGQPIPVPMRRIVARR